MRLKTFEIVNLVNYSVNRIVPKQFREIEKVAIITRIKEVTNFTGHNLTREQVLQIIYKELKVETI